MTCRFCRVGWTSPPDPRNCWRCGRFGAYVLPRAKGKKRKPHVTAKQISTGLAAAFARRYSGVRGSEAP